MFHIWKNGTANEPCDNCGMPLTQAAMSVVCNSAPSVVHNWRPSYFKLGSGSCASVDCADCGVSITQDINLNWPPVGPCVPVTPPGQADPSHTFVTYHGITSCSFCGCFETSALAGARCVGIMPLTFDDCSWAGTPTPKKDPICECGAKKASGIENFKPGHSAWCDVAEGKQ